MKRVRSGPSIRKFLQYYLLVLLACRSQTKRELIQAIKEKSANNRRYRSRGVLWVAASEMDKALKALKEDGLVKAGVRSNKWSITRAGRQARWRYERESEQHSEGKEKAARKLLSLLKPTDKNKHILDVGTGQGFLAFKMAARGFQVLGIDSCTFDYSKDSIQKAREQIRSTKGKVEFRKGDVARLRGLDRRFDYVTASQAVHCMKNQRKSLQAIYRLLKPGGRFLCLDFSVGLKGFLKHGFHDFLAISREEWEELLPEYGFQDVEIYHISDFLVVTVRKPLSMKRKGSPSALRRI